MRALEANTVDGTHPLQKYQQTDRQCKINVVGLQVVSIRWRTRGSIACIHRDLTSVSWPAGRCVQLRYRLTAALVIGLYEPPVMPAVRCVQQQRCGGACESSCVEASWPLSEACRQVRSVSAAPVRAAVLRPHNHAWRRVCGAWASRCTAPFSYWWRA